MNLMEASNALLDKFSNRLHDEKSDFEIRKNQFTLTAALRAAGSGNFATTNIDQFQRSLRLGEGINITELLTTKSSPFVPAAYQPPPVVSTQLTVEYVYGADNVSKLLGGGTELSASLKLPNFSIGPKFKSSEMQEQQSERIDGHMVIYSKPTYDFIELGDNTLSPAAQTLFDDQGLLAFYGRYGTHYVSAVKPDSVYAAIFSFYFDSSNTRQSFENEVQLNFGFKKAFSADFSDKVKTALEVKSRHVSFVFHEIAATEIGLQPLTVPAAGSSTDPALDLLTPGELIKRYNAYIAGLLTAKKIPIVEVRLSPLADIVAPAISATLPTATLELSASIKANIDDMLSDFNVMVQSPDLWRGMPDWQLANALATQRDELSNAMLAVLVDPSDTNKTKLTDLNTSTANTAHQFFLNIEKPSLADIKLTKNELDDTTKKTTIEFKIRSDIRLAKPFIAIYGNKLDAEGRLNTIFVDLIKDDSENAPAKVFWRSGSIMIEPVDGSALRIEAVDSIGRSRDVILYAGNPTVLQLPLDTWTELY